MARVTPGRKAEYVSTCTGNVESGFFGGSFLIASVKEKKKNYHLRLWTRERVLRFEE